MQWIKDLKDARRVAKYWHAEMFIFVPWLVWFSYEIYQIRKLLEIVAHG